MKKLKILKKLTLLMALVMVMAALFGACAAPAGNAHSSAPASASAQVSASESAPASEPASAAVSESAPASESAAASASASSGATLSDRTGAEYKVPQKLETIISLAPSNTEILSGLGLLDKLVAVDTYSAAVKGVDGSLPQIDIMNPDAETIISLHPDLVLAADINKYGQEEMFALLEKNGIDVVFTPIATSLEDVKSDINFIAELTGTKEKGTAMVGDMDKVINEVKKKAASAAEKKTVYFEIDPTPYAAGSKTFIDDMISIAGGKNIYSDKEGYVAADAETIIKRNPDVIITNLSYDDKAVGEIKARDGWQNIAAIKNGHVYCVNADLTSRTSQFAVEGLKEIAKALYPEIYE